MFKNLKLITLVIGCFSTSLFASPQWFNEIPQQAGFIIGIGVGETMVEAKQSAMTDIGNSLYSNVSSTIANKVKVHNENVDTEFLSNKVISSDDVLLPKVTWAKLEVVENNNYAMAKVSIADIVALYEQNLALQMREVENLVTKEKLSLNDYLQLVAANKELKLAAKRAVTLASLSGKQYAHFSQIMSLFNKQNQFIGSVCFDVKESRDRLADKIYLPAIESAVQADNFELKKSASCIPVKFRSKTEKTGKTIAHVTMQLTIGSPSITSNVIKFKGRSNGSYKAAMFDAADQFSHYFHTTGGLLNALLQESNKSIVID